MGTTCVLSALSRESTSPGLGKQTFVALRKQDTDKPNECPSGEYFSGKRVLTKEKENGTKLWESPNSAKSNLIAPERYRYYSMNIFWHLALFLDLLPCPKVRNLPSNCFPRYPACCSFLNTGLECCSPLPSGLQGPEDIIRSSPFM